MQQSQGWGMRVFPIDRCGSRRERMSEEGLDILWDLTRIRMIIFKKGSTELGRQLQFIPAKTCQLSELIKQNQYSGTFSAGHFAYSYVLSVSERFENILIQYIQHVFICKMVRALLCHQQYWETICKWITIAFNVTWTITWNVNKHLFQKKDTCKTYSQKFLK